MTTTEDVKAADSIQARHKCTCPYQRRGGGGGVALEVVFLCHHDRHICSHFGRAEGQVDAATMQRPSARKLPHNRQIAKVPRIASTRA